MKLFLMCTKFLVTVGTFYKPVCVFRKPFWMSVKCYLPANQQQKRDYKQRPEIAFSHKKERCEHHRIIPVIYSAGAAAFVLHKPGLEWTEKQDTYNVTYWVCTAQQYHKPIIQKTCHMECSKYHIKSYPYQKNKHSGIVILNDDVSLACFYVIGSKLFLTAGTFKFWWKKPKDHFHNKTPHMMEMIAGASSRRLITVSCPLNLLKI